ncbi:putative ribonuclease H-like domain-containing protein, partial [Tanacetum coccineum]
NHDDRRDSLKRYMVWHAGQVYEVSGDEGSIDIQRCEEALDGKADEGFFVGYSINSKAFRVFNSRTRIVEENLHVQFSENTPNIAGSRPNWLFDIDILTKSMNYKPVITGNQSNGNAGTKACDDAGKARIETSSPDAGFKPSVDNEKKVTKEPGKEGGYSSNDQDKEDNVNSTNNVNVASTNKVNVVGAKTSIELPYDLNMPELEDIVYSDDDEDVGAEDDINNLNAFMPVSPIPTTRIHKDHTVQQIIRDLNSAPQTRRMTKNLEKHGFEDPDFPDRVYKVEKALYGLHQAPRAWYETLSTYLLEIGVSRGMFRQGLCLSKWDKGELTFFLRLQVKQKEDGIFINQDKYVTEILKKFGFTNVKTASTPLETQKHLVKDEDSEEVDVYLYISMIGSLMYLTSSRPDILVVWCACTKIQVNPKSVHLMMCKRIFRYLKGQPKLGLWYPKDSPFDLVAYIDSDYARASLDMKSTIRGCQFLGCRLISWQCKKQTVVANSTTEAEYVAASSCCGQVLWIQNQLLDYGDSNEKKLIQMIKIHTDKNVADLLTKAFDATVKVKTVNGEQQLQALVDGKKIVVTKASVRRDLQLDDEEGTSCLPNTTIFEELIRMRAKTTAWNEFSSTMASAIICFATNQKFNFSKYIFESMVKNLDNAGKFLMYPRRSKRKDTEVPQPSDPTNVADEAVNEEPSMQLEELMDFCTKLQQRVLDLENTKTAQAQEITSLKLRVKKLEKKGGLRTHKLKRLYKGSKIYDIDADEDITLENVHDAEIFDVNDLHGDEVFVEKEVPIKEVSAVGKVNTASIATTISAATITEDEKTLAQALAELKSVKPKVTTATTTTTKGILLQEPSESITKTTTTIPSKDKGKAEFDEEVRLAREKDEANVAIIKEWNDIQAKIDANYQMAKQMQAEEQEELIIEEKSKLVNTFVDMDKKLVEGSKVKAEGSEVRAEGSETREESSSKRAGDELEKENVKKQKVDDDQEAAKMKELMKIVHDEEEVPFDAIPLATKPPSIIDWKIVKEGKISYYQIIRADGSSKSYTRPKEGYERVLWGDLKTMFEHHVEDIVWRNLQGNKVLVWKLFDSCEVHFVRFQSLHVFMLVEKRYPLTPATIIEMLNKKLQADH